MEKNCGIDVHCSDGLDHQGKKKATEMNHDILYLQGYSMMFVEVMTTM